MVQNILLKCELRSSLKPNAEVAEDSRFIKKLIGFCIRRKININQFFCEKCRSPNVPCPNCNGLLQIRSHRNTYTCINCNSNFTYNKINWIKINARSRKFRLLKR